MSVFLGLVGQIFPLYLMIAFGYVASKKLHVARESIAPLLIYIISPVVVFTASLNVTISVEVLGFPWFMFAVSAALCLLFYWVGKFFWSDTTRNIFAFSAGTGNTGYFGIPLALLLFEPDVANLYIFTMLASLLYESTIGFYIIARGNYTFRQSLLKVARLPSLYAMHLGLVCNYFGWFPEPALMEFMEYFKGTFAILGMMMIGMGLKGVRENGMDFRFVGMTFFTKFVVWPLVVFALIYIDQTWLGFLNDALYKVMFVFAVVPLAANAVSMAVLLNAAPEKASFAVLLSTLFSLVSIPLMSMLFL
jgi:predicted permease